MRSARYVFSCKLFRLFQNIGTRANLGKFTHACVFHHSYDILARDISKFAVVYFSLFIAFSFAINYSNQAYVQYAIAVNSSSLLSNYTSGCPNQIQTFADVAYELFTMAFGDNLSGTLALARGPPCGGLEVCFLWAISTINLNGLLLLRLSFYFFSIICFSFSRFKFFFWFFTLLKFFLWGFDSF